MLGSSTPAITSPHAVSCANTGTCVSTVLSRKSLYQRIGFPAACFATIFGIVAIHRAEAPGTGTTPPRSTTPSFVITALANQSPTTMRRIASQWPG